MQSVKIYYCIRFLAVLMEVSISLIFFTRSALTPSNSSTQDATLEPYCTSLETMIV